MQVLGHKSVKSIAFFSVIQYVKDLFKSVVIGAETKKIENN